MRPAIKHYRQSMGAVWVVFSLSFVVALSGAMVPGPLLTYTVIKTLQSRRRGYLMGLWVIIGHSLLESVLIVAILLGLSRVLKAPAAVRVIGGLGGAFLVYLGASLVRDVVKGRVRLSLDDEAGGGSAEPRGLAKLGPLWGGVLISMSNPYWWIWWASIGFAFMLQYGISFAHWPLLLAFFVGHEGGDLAWYVAVSTLVHLGRKRINQRLYRIALLLCAAVMAGLGVYLGASAFLYTADPASLP